MGKPFKVNTPPETNVNAGTRVRSPALVKVFDHVKSGKDNDDLYAAARELGSAPDKQVGSTAASEIGQNKGEDHIQQPGYQPAIPWPAAPGVAHKPFKI